FAQGASLEDLLTLVSIPKRTLQRYLAILSIEGYLQASGQGRARRYYIPLETPAPPEELLIPLSSEALSIQNNVGQPVQARNPVGYNQKFLNTYRPNETYYLPENTRYHLRTIGKSPDGKRPAGTYARQILNRLLIDLSWNSSRLEGNTYSLLETERL